MKTAAHGHMRPRWRAWRCLPFVFIVFGVPLPGAASSAAALTSADSAKAAPSRAPHKKRSHALDEFKRAIDRYRKIHDKEEAKIGPLPKTANPAAITRRQHALGEAIRTARAGARQGEIFTPGVAEMIKRVVAQDLRSRTPVDRQAFIVSQPETDVRVNDFYPTTVPLATVPPKLLAELPELPDGLEYRFVNGALILRDVDPNLVADLLPGVVPPPSRKQ